MMKQDFWSGVSLNNKTFKQMFASYVCIIVLCFLAYSSIVIHEAIVVRREQAQQYYTLKLQDVQNALDNQIARAQTIVSGINNSYLVRQFAINVRQNKSGDAYLLYQMLNDLQHRKAASESLYIDDLVLFLNQYNKAYTGGVVLSLELEENRDETVWTQALPSMRIDTLNERFSLKNTQIVCNKTFLIYQDAYRYAAGEPRGQICVLFDKDGISSMLNQLAGDTCGWAFQWNGETLLEQGRMEGVVFEGASRLYPNLTYRLTADPAEFMVSGSVLWSVALSVGFAVCVCYVILAYIFTYRYYKPWKHIRQLLGNREKEVESDSENEISRIVVDVENLVGERDNYREQMITISPYAEQGMLHSIFSGNTDVEWDNLQPLMAYVKLEKMYVLVASVSLAYIGNESCEKEEIRRIKHILRQKAEEYSDESLHILCQDQEMFFVYLIFNSDAGEKLEDTLCDFYANVQKAIDRKDYVITIGADEIQEQVSRIREACIHSRKALRGMLTGGRDGVYFYEPGSEENADYYFPQDAVRSMVKMMKENDQEGLKAFLQTLMKKNQSEYDLSLAAIQLLEDELYMAVVKAIRTISSIYTLSIQVEKPVYAMTFEELIEYYFLACRTVCEQVMQNTESENEVGQTAQEIIRYVDEHYTDDDISLTYITEKFHVSNKYVSYIFKKQFGITYLQYVQEKRVAYAVRLLKTTDDTLEKIADSCGYTNLLTFRRNFKAIMNANPSDFRKRL